MTRSECGVSLWMAADRHTLMHLGLNSPNPALLESHGMTCCAVLCTPVILSYFAAGSPAGLFAVQRDQRHPAAQGVLRSGGVHPRAPGSHFLQLWCWLRHQGRLCCRGRWGCCVDLVDSGSHGIVLLLGCQAVHHRNISLHHGMQCRAVLSPCTRCSHAPV